jgi:glycolate oxidase FAD binding subunit
MTLGVEFVTGAGDIVRGGGRVVKNVAGFDLTRLVTGSWGTLGVLTEVTLRLRALPAVETTLAIDLGGGSEVERAWEALRALPFTPLAAQLFDARLARVLGVAERGPVLLVRLGGNEEAVRAQCVQLRTVGETRTIDGEPWRALRVAEPLHAVVLRLSHRPSLFAATWVDAARIIERWPGGYGHGDPGRGVVRIVLPCAAEVSETIVSAALDVPSDRTRIYERLPAKLWDRLAPSAFRNRLDRDIKATFDPTNVLNPGILGTTQ